MSNKFTEAMAEIEKQSEDYWNSLSKQQQLDAFCAVARRIHKGDLEDKGSYRYVLYSVFGFGPEAYAPAQLAGYLDIHNCIYDYDHDDKLLEEFCKYLDLKDALYVINRFLKNDWNINHDQLSFDFEEKKDERHARSEET